MVTRRRRGDGCFVCGGPCDKPCVDNTGQPYMGCRKCRFVLPDTTPAPSEVDKLRARLALAEKVIAAHVPLRGWALMHVQTNEAAGRQLDEADQARALWEKSK